MVGRHILILTSFSKILFMFKLKELDITNLSWVHTASTVEHSLYTTMIN